MPSSSPIAIIGLAGAFAQSKDLAAYWQNILAEADCITGIPETHWSVSDFYDPDPHAPDRTYCKRGGFLPPIEFNPLEFGLPPNILEATDVSQLLALAMAKQALADAGYAESNPWATSTGVILGVSSLKLIEPLVCRLQTPVWRRVLRNSRVPESEIESIIHRMKLAYVGWQEDSFPGYLSNVVAGRITNRLGLGGINCSVDAACASSLASVAFAMRELQSGSCDMMLAGGVDTNNSAMAYLSFSKTPAFTAHDHMRPFDSASDGMLIGEGLGILVLKRLADAERDGDRIYAVIRGIGASSDGRSKSIYAPRIEGQELAMRRALKSAECEPDSIGFIEAHGTGTPAGDPTEFTALHSVYGNGTGEGKRIAVGSVKSQIGHTKVAAGAASLIKATLALHHRILPPTINVAQPHPGLKLDGSPFYLNTTTRPWFSSGLRRAAVSSFGFGGTNFHAILEEFPCAASKPARRHPGPSVILLHAPDPTGLLELCERTAAQLQTTDGPAHFSILAREATSAEIPADSARLGFVADNSEHAASLLTQALQVLRASPAAEAQTLPGGVFHRARGVDPASKVVALFPGQGSQYPEMGKALCLNFPAVHDAYASMDAVLARHWATPITDIVFPPPSFDDAARQEQAARLQRTNHAQPAIGAFSLGLFRLLRQAGFAPDFAAGHSLGELTALCAAGAIPEADFLELLHARGQAMASSPAPDADPGTMLAVSGDVDALKPFLADYPDVSIANTNSRSQLVLAGSRPSLEVLQAELAALGNHSTFLPVAAAFHSPFVGHAREPFAARLGTISFATPAIPVYSNATATAYPEATESIRELLAEHLVSPVNFRRELDAIYDAGGRIFVEIGPGGVLTGLVGNILANKPHLAIALNSSRSGDSDLQFRQAYAQLRVAGLSLRDFEPGQTLPLPATSRPGLTIRLTGASYVSDKTRAAFEAALDSPAPPQSTMELQMTAIPNNPQPEIGPAESQDDRSQAHLKYLENTAGHSDKHFLLIQQLYGLISSAQVDRAALEIFERGMNQFHDQLRMLKETHEQYLSGADAVARPVPALPLANNPLRRAPVAAPVLPAHQKPAIAREPAPFMVPAPRPAAPPLMPPSIPVVAPVAKSMPPATPPVAKAAARPSGAAEIGAVILAVVSEKTGYPLDSLALSMDLEADLGIDSLKRVEIMAALDGEVIASLADLNVQKFSELRTIGQIADFLVATERAATEKKTLAS